MADALVGATAQVLLEKLLSMATDNIGLIFGFKKDLEALRRSVEKIRAVIADAEEKQLNESAVKLWLKDLEKLAYDADNVFDDLNYEMLRRKVHNRNQPLFFSFSKTNLAFRWRMAGKVRDITVKLKLITKEAKRFGLQSQLGVAANAINVGLTLRWETDSFVKQTVVGRAEDASMIAKKLLSPSSEVVSFMPIIGMGGLGKTTLAQLVYNDVQIESHFDKRIWVCVSVNFDITSLFKLILESLTSSKVEITSRDVIVKNIKKELEGKRYLLVLDDVWEENSQRWSDFLGSLNGISTTKGNWIIVTTRKLQVTSNLPACHPLNLENLSDHDCWSIAKEKSLLGDEVLPEMEAIREKVTTICQGLPLLASVIGGLLRKEPREKWLSIVNKGISNLRRDGNDVMQILKFSFDHLPSSSIKKCFAYCSLFSKDADIDKEQLIQLWMAEGFLNPNSDNEKVMEDIGEDYFSILVQSSLLQEVKDDYDGTISGRMHDLVHDLAQSISKSEMINLQDGLRDPNCHARYFVASSLFDKILPSSLHTLFLADCRLDGRLNFKYLRTLKLSRVKIKELPTSMNKLIHLRYLDLSDSAIQALPKSLCKLYQLETLRLSWCLEFKEFPEGMSNLVCLRHLYYYNKKGAFIMPRDMGKLTCLQTLMFFNVSQEKGCRIEELGYLRNLRGELEIRNLELVNCKEEAEGANLVGKPNLSKLKLLWHGNRPEGDIHDEEVMEGLQPHPNLSELRIEGFMGRKFASWISMNNDQRLGGLSSRLLNTLLLLKCQRCTEIPTLGHLAFLEHLYLQKLDNVTCIGHSFYYDPIDEDFKNTCASGFGRSWEKKMFPSLKSLKLYEMSNLVEWKEPETSSAGGSRGGEEQTGVLIFPKLEELIIEKCPKLTTAPSNLPSLKELRIEGVGKLLPETNICSKVTTLVRVDVCQTGGFQFFGDVVFSNNANILSLKLVSYPDLTRVRGRSNSLKRLEIQDCGNLRELPEDLLKCCSLEELYIFNCPSLESIRVPIPSSSSSSSSNRQQHQHQHRLRKLSIGFCNGLKSLRGAGECELGADDDHSSSSSASSSNTILLPLQHLHVYGCSSLESLTIDIRNAPSLSLLDCPKLITLPKFSSSFLRKLGIGPLKSEDWPELSSLSSLSELYLFRSPLPHDLQCLTSLTVLTLNDLEIEALPDWFGNLASLEELHLWDCLNLRYLPSMEAMKRLTKLHYLNIGRCPLLKERCINPTTFQTSSSSGTDSEWSKISRIPRIGIYPKDLRHTPLSHISNIED